MARKSNGDPTVGQRMLRAMEDAGLSVAEAARQIGRDARTVHYWLRGEREPTASDMLGFCQVVGRTVEEMYGVEVGERLATALLRLVDRLMAGRPLGRAVEAEFGAALTPEERTRLDQGSAVMREFVAQQAAREWDLLSDDEKRQVLEQIHRLAAEREQGRQGGYVIRP